MFGITMRDIAVYKKINAAGITVSEVYSAYRSGTLREDLKIVIDEYEAALKADREIVERAK